MIRGERGKEKKREYASEGEREERKRIGCAVERAHRVVSTKRVSEAPCVTLSSTIDDHRAVTIGQL